MREEVMSELSGVELRRAVAEKIGWTGLVTYPHGGEIFGFRPGEELGEDLRGSKVPHYELSLDACMRDGLPSPRERGYPDFDLSLRHHVRWGACRPWLGRRACW